MFLPILIFDPNLCSLAMSSTGISFPSEQFSVCQTESKRVRMAVPSGLGLTVLHQTTELDMAVPHGNRITLGNLFNLPRVYFCSTT